MFVFALMNIHESYIFLSQAPADRSQLLKLLQFKQLN